MRVKYFIALEIFTEMPSLQLLSGPACGVVAGSKIPNYCVMSDTSNVARVMEKMGEGMRSSVVTNSQIGFNTENQLHLVLENDQITNG